MSDTKKLKHSPLGLYFIQAMESYNEVVRRMEYRLDNAAKIEGKKKKKMIELKREVDAIRAKKLKLKDLAMSQLKTMCK